MSQPADAVLDLKATSAAAVRAFQSQQLRTTIALCQQGHAFYKRRWAEAGVVPSTIRTVDDLEALPLTRKQDLIASPEDFVLRIPDLPLHERSIWSVVHTTGSSGNPTPLYVTPHDFHANVFQARRFAELVGLKGTDVYANLFPLTAAAMGAFTRVADNAYAVGASVITALPGAPHGTYPLHRTLDETVEIVARHRATVFWGMPSYIRRVLIRAQELSADLRTLRMCVTTGEPAPQILKDDIKARMRALGAAGDVLADRYGSTEGGSLGQCHDGFEWHNPSPETVFYEVVDPDSGKRMSEGQRGALAVTHLSRRGTVLLRYVVGDIVAVETDRCKHCGRFGERIIGPIQRASDFVKVKGMLINPAQLYHTIRHMPAVEELQVVVTKSAPGDTLSMDELVLRIALKPAATAPGTDDFVAAAAKEVGVRPRIELVGLNDIFDPSRDTKMKTFVDMRGA
jgi:phenylacetate-CoA ligase